MRSIALLALAIAILAVAAFCGGPLSAADGQNTADLAAAGKAGAEAAAPALLSGNWVAGIFGFLMAAIPGALHVLQRQAQDRWNIFHSQNTIDAAKAAAAAAAK